MTTNTEALGQIPVTIEEVELPSGVSGIEANFGPEKTLKGYSAVVVTDTISDDNPGSDDGNRLITVVAHFPRCILSEINTHRVFSRNSASSRARSFKATFREVMENPYIPLFTVNKKGMSGDFVNVQQNRIAKREWLVARDEAVVSALRLLLGEHVELGDALQNWEAYIDKYYDEVYNSESPLEGAPNIHKQNVNRLLEPFMWHEVVITSSMWENFFNLRVSDTAQPEIYAIARLIQEAVRNSTPVVRNLHLPFIDDAGYPSEDDFSEILEKMMESAGTAAQVSYKKVGKEGSQSKVDAAKLSNRLLESRHMSPFEHQAMSFKLGEDFLPELPKNYGGNLGESWVQYRRLLES